MGQVKQGFERQIIPIPVDRILPTRSLDKDIEQTKKYLTILTSIRELGVIEPLAVHRQQTNVEGTAAFVLLDGHLRLHALKALGATEALCLLSIDDEGFTYNRQINRLTPVQEHKMILTAVRKGISPAMIAKVLGINVERIHDRQRMLDGIAPEVVEMLKVKMVSQGVFRTLRKMKPMRQIETVELMVSANCFTQTYAEMVLAASRPDMLIEKKSKLSAEVSVEELARMEREMEKLFHDYKVVEDTLGETMLFLVVAKGYLARLLRNETISGYLKRCHSELLDELTAIMEAVSSDARKPERE
ncbi:plasmid partitioning protein RepB C-terminal domain-containing protein [Pseudomonas lurida]|uniref:plasmid partitioning protein RepB C-terminal domain-containing protein n=1 Tax=Pseudomonas lurida TaxID=244566 RepID=UPI001F2BB2DF|nr:plasmid partitioning protein RepB C-terminal domain-containing protein [Pseudomonas lurida]MCF5023871.1 chromosome partitioning protein [Pseudomonas lurida]MCF5307133.1 chromosome partitioning protein [Pseudomonas lurida]MCF5327292.1 chromosome partitioning protein [Pseudomonas lurida]